MAPRCARRWGQGPPADGRHPGLQGSALRVRGRQRGQRGRSRQPLESPPPKDAKKKTGWSKTRRMQEAFASHRLHIGRTYPRVVPLTDPLAPWHRGRAGRSGTAGQPALGVEAPAQRQPAVEPDRAILEETPLEGHAQPVVRHPGRDLRSSLRASLCYFQTMRHKVRSIIEGRPKWTASK